MSQTRKRRNLPLEEKLTPEEKAIFVASILTDGFLEFAKGNVNARFGIQLRVADQPYLNFFIGKLKRWFLVEPAPVWKIPPGGTVAFEQLQVRTFAHPVFLELYFEFYKFFGPDNKKKKTVPPLSYLMENLTFEGLSHMISQDGSIKSDESKGIEIHLQSFSYYSLCRLSVALYQKLGLKAHVASYTESNTNTNTNEQKYNVYISGESHDILLRKVVPFLHPTKLYKIPKERVRLITGPNLQSVWVPFYKEVKDKPFLEDISLDF